MSKRWLKDFLRYIHKVFLPESWTKWAKDKRKDPEIEPGTIWVTLLIGSALQVQSLEELDPEGSGRPRRILSATLDWDETGRDQKAVCGSNQQSTPQQDAAVNRLLPRSDHRRHRPFFHSEPLLSCLSGSTSSGRDGHEHKVVTCQIVGGKPPLIIGQEPLCLGKARPLLPGG